MINSKMVEIEIENKIENENENENEKQPNKHYQKYSSIIKATATKWMKENKEEVNRQYRERYANDPELRERIKLKARDRARKLRAEKLAQLQAK